MLNLKAIVFIIRKFCDKQTIFVLVILLIKKESEGMQLTLYNQIQWS